MVNTNLALKNQENVWDLAIWDYIVEETAKVFRLSTEESLSLQNSNTAKLIATIPFAAGCNNPERTAIAHIGIYLMELKGYQEYCSHLPSDDSDIYSRLERISNFNGGNQEIIDHGMAMLALIMVEGYKKSEEEDRINGVYNPLVSGAWNYDTLIRMLQRKIEEVDCPDLDDVYYNYNHIIRNGW